MVGGLAEKPRAQGMPTGRTDGGAAPLDRIRVVLIEPLQGGNVGSVCRAMANMGLSDLALVRPRPLNEQSRWMACHAQEVLDRRTEFDSVAQAVADCGVVVGTTAREGLYRRHAQTPREWAPQALQAACNGRAALLFGREDRGLTNEELALCMHIVRIPTADGYRSLNLAQAVMVLCYELFMAEGTYEAPQEKSPEAASSLRERMFALWRETLLDIGFMDGEKADHMMFGLRRIFARGARTEDDVQILMGISRQVDWAARQAAASRPVSNDAEE